MRARLIAAACGDDDRETLPEIPVEATENEVLPVGLLRPGALVHELAIREKGGDTLGRIDAGPGEEATLTVDLKRGQYEMVCREPGHLEAGMRAELSVG